MSSMFHLVNHPVASRLLRMSASGSDVGKFVGFCVVGSCYMVDFAHVEIALQDVLEFLICQHVVCDRFIVFHCLLDDEV